MPYFAAMSTALLTLTASSGASTLAGALSINGPDCQGELNTVVTVENFGSKKRAHQPVTTA